ncbi:J domain-containing protein [Alkalinema pantanalense CENA528]|uniref:J domain-containing protein n=1 Tax=Alkalinema pantanalense TaxID=1620705 RepID=UPI003D6DCCCC
MNIRQCYEVLELNPPVSHDDLKQAYKDLVQVWHPDRFSHNPRLRQKAEEKLKQINVAYESLEHLLTQQAITQQAYSQRPSSQPTRSPHSQSPHSRTSQTSQGTYQWQEFTKTGSTNQPKTFWNQLSLKTRMQIYGVLLTLSIFALIWSPIVLAYLVTTYPLFFLIPLCLIGIYFGLRHLSKY